MRGKTIGICAAVLWMLSVQAVPAQTLRTGMSGGEVAAFQTALSDAGYFARAADGEYGSATAKAVAVFQSEHGLAATGTADEKTQKAVQKAKKKGGRKGGGILMTAGNRGQDVQECQLSLIRAGFLSGAADSVFGPATEKAVREFQKEKGLPVSGVIDEETMKALSRRGEKGKRSSGEKTLQPGSRGRKVAELQNLLTHHGFAPDASDGIYGQGTAEQVQKFQRYNGLKETGKADEDVWEKLRSAPLFQGRYRKVLRMQASAYTPHDSGGTGHTASGNIAGKGHAAVDPSVIPLGSLIYIEGYGYAVADDIGGSVSGDVIDVCVDTLDQAYGWGRRRVNVYII